MVVFPRRTGKVTGSEGRGRRNIFLVRRTNRDTSVHVTVIRTGGAVAFKGLVVVHTGGNAVNSFLGMNDGIGKNTVKQSGRRNSIDFFEGLPGSVGISDLGHYVRSCRSSGRWRSRGHFAGYIDNIGIVFGND